MRIGEVARRAGLSVHTLRFYEREGLLARAPRTTSNYRDYSPTAVERLAFIRGAQRVGFTLAEVRALLDLRNTPLGCAELRQIGERKLADIDNQLRQLQEIRASIQTLLRDCARTPAQPCTVRIAIERTRRG